MKVDSPEQVQIEIKQELMSPRNKSNGTPPDKSTILNARKKEKWYYENMMLKESTNDGYIVDGDWMNRWMEFVIKEY